MSAWKCVKAKLPGSHSGQLHGFAVAAVSPTRFLVHGGTPGATQTPSKSLLQLDNIGLGALTEAPAANGAPAGTYGGVFARAATTKVFAFGGSPAPAATPPPLAGDVAIYNSALRSWSAPRCSGAAPPPALHATALLVGTAVYVFGGRTAAGATAAVHRFNVATSAWSAVAVAPGAPAPAPRWRHTMCLTAPGARSFVVYGGCDGTRAFDDAWVFDTDTATWARVGPAAGAAVAPARAGHAAEVLAGALWVYGGDGGAAGDGRAPLGDLWRLDLATGAWTAFGTGGADAPAPGVDNVFCPATSATLVLVSGANIAHWYVFNPALLGAPAPAPAAAPPAALPAAAVATPPAALPAAATAATMSSENLRKMFELKKQMMSGSAPKPTVAAQPTATAQPAAGDAQLEAKLKEAAEKHARAEAELQQVRGRLEAVERDLRSTTEKHAKVHAELATSNARVAELEKKLQAEQQQRQQQQQQKPVAAADPNVSRLEQEVASLKTQLAAARKDAETHSARATAAEREVATLRAKAARTDTLEKELQASKARVQELEAALKAASSAPAAVAPAAPAALAAPPAAPAAPAAPGAPGAPAPPPPPPPPPPSAPAPPPPPSPAGGGMGGNSALLAAIQKGTKLKKVTPPKEPKLTVSVSSSSGTGSLSSAPGTPSSPAGGMGGINLAEIMAKRENMKKVTKPPTSPVAEAPKPPSFAANLKKTAPPTPKSPTGPVNQVSFVGQLKHVSK